MEGLVIIYKIDVYIIVARETSKMTIRYWFLKWQFALVQKKKCCKTFYRQQQLSPIIKSYFSAYLLKQNSCFERVRKFSLKKFGLANFIDFS